MGIGTNYSSLYTLRVYPRSTATDHAIYVSDGTGGTDSYTLYVAGDAFSTGGWTSSDRRLKKNQKNLVKSKLKSKLSKIYGKTYEFKTRDELLAMHHSGEAHFPVDTTWVMQEVTDENGVVNMIPTGEIEEIVIDVPKYGKGTRYGLNAQEVMEEFPELVQQDKNTGLYAVDYQGFIPILLEAYKEQEEEIRKLKRKINKVANGNGNAGREEGETPAGLEEGPSFGQNIPNPSDGATSIPYFVPADAQKATINVYDLNGQKIKSYELRSGNDILRINHGELKAGLYLYNMIVDGESLSTKRLIME